MQLCVYMYLCVCMYICEATESSQLVLWCSAICSLLKIPSITRLLVQCVYVVVYVYTYLRGNFVITTCVVVKCDLLFDENLFNNKTLGACVCVFVYVYVSASQLCHYHCFCGEGRSALAVAPSITRLLVLCVYVLVHVYIFASQLCHYHCFCGAA